MNTAPLTYAETRPRIMSGDVLAWSLRDGWFSSFHNFKVRVVRMFTSSEFDHNAVAWVIGGRVFALEAVMPLVRIYPLSKLGDFYWLPMGKWTPDAEEFALAHIGTPYSQAKAIRAFFGPVAHDEQEECAEYVIETLGRAGVDLGPIATPSEVVRAAQMQGSPCQLIINLETS